MKQKYSGLDPSACLVDEIFKDLQGATPSSLKLWCPFLCGVGLEAVFHLVWECLLGLKSESNTMGDDHDRVSEILAKLAAEGWASEMGFGISKESHSGDRIGGSSMEVLVRGARGLVATGCTARTSR